MRIANAVAALSLAASCGQVCGGCTNTTYYGDPSHRFDGPECWSSRAWIDSLGVASPPTQELEYALTVTARPEGECSGLIAVDSFEVTAVDTASGESIILYAGNEIEDRDLQKVEALNRVLLLPWLSYPNAQVWVLFSLFDTPQSPPRHAPMTYHLKLRRVLTAGGV